MTARTSASGPRDEVGRAGDERQQQDAGPQLAGEVPQLADVPLAKRPPGGERDDGACAQFSADIEGRPAQRAERPVLRRPQRGDRPGKADRGAVTGRHPLGNR